MSSNKTSCQTSLFSILISFITNESYVLTKYHLSCPICIRISQQKKDGVCLEKFFFATETVGFGETWLTQKLFLSTFFISYLSPQFQSLEKEASRTFHKKKMDFQFLFLLWPTNNMFLLKEAYFHLSSLNCINCFLTKEITALLIMKGSYLSEDQYKLKSYILRGPGYNHCWVSAVSNLAKCRKCFYWRGNATWHQGSTSRRITDVRISYFEKYCRLWTGKIDWTNDLLGTIQSISKFEFS